MFIQTNPVLTHADVVLPQSAPSGSTLSATDAVVSTGFFIYAPDRECNTTRLHWRILIQVVAMQLNEYYRSNGDAETWKPRILETLQRINNKAQEFSPSSFPSDIVPPTAEYLALSVAGVNWCDTLTRQLTCLFLNVPSVGTTKIN